ncbi:hypothetical protein [Oceanithermus sp.]|uniref:hypothetical protein n=1 Tax=Oceanithermus sp. TaxID=2268145 RepID=UPI00257C2274|nr:hypothetical protein [Oceanithermus sp.]
MKRAWTLAAAGLLAAFALAAAGTYSPLLGVRWPTPPHPESSSVYGAQKSLLAFQASVLMYQGQRCEEGELYAWPERDNERILTIAKEVARSIAEAGWVGQWNVDAFPLYFPKADTGAFGVFAQGSTRHLVAIGLAAYEGSGLLLFACRISP